MLWRIHTEYSTRGLISKILAHAKNSPKQQNIKLYELQKKYKSINFNAQYKYIEILFCHAKKCFDSGTYNMQNRIIYLKYDDTNCDERAIIYCKLFHNTAHFYIVTHNRNLTKFWAHFFLFMLNKSLQNPVQSYISVVKEQNSKRPLLTDGRIHWIIYSCAYPKTYRKSGYYKNKTW